MTRLLADFSQLKIVGFVRDHQLLAERVKLSAPGLLIVEDEIARALGVKGFDLLRSLQPSLLLLVCGKEDSREVATSWPGVTFLKVATTSAAECEQDAFLKHRIAKALHADYLTGPSAPERMRSTANPAPCTVAKPMSSRKIIKAVVVGVSTGGPDALIELFRAFDRDFPLPIAVVQHMPAGFTKMLAERLDRISPLRVIEGTPGLPFVPGQVVIGPGGQHMLLHGPASSPSIQLNNEIPENSCRPAVDVLFRSAAQVFGGSVLAIVLTGMGRDGLAGAKILSSHGAPVLVQDAATSTVWGMPGAIAQAGLADAVLPLSSMLPELMRYL